MSAGKPIAWPLAKPGAKVILFEPFPFGVDQRGRPVDPHADVRLDGHRRDAPAWARRSPCGCCCSPPRWTPLAELHVYDLKGTGDLSPLEPVAHRYRPAATTDDHRRT